MLQDGDKRVISEEKNESTYNNSQMLMPEVNSVLLLSSPFAIVVHSVQ